MNGYKRLSGLRVVVAAAITLAAVGPIAAQPAPGTSCAVTEIDASNSGEPSVDPTLGQGLERKLKKPPFSSWNTFKSLGSQTRTLAPQKAESLRLAHGTLALLLLDSTSTRVRLGVTLDDQTGKRVLDTKVAVDVGDWMALARSLKGERGQIIAFRCGNR